MAVALESSGGPIRMTKPPNPSDPDPEEDALAEVKARFGADVQAARERRGWKQEELAAQCGITRERISKIENGHENLTLRTVIRITNALQLPVPKLLQCPEAVPRPISKKPPKI